jgi:thiamine pyrophosphate-dependent acetolactate synthase large subunit-like protein
MKVYQAVLDQLIGAGVTYFSGMIGSTAAPYAATLADRNDMRYVGVRHEHTAASILDATARLTGKPGCLMVHGASGFLAASAGIASAALDSTPMFILSATQERRAMESGWWQTMNVQTPLSDVLKWQKRVERPDQAIEAVRAALREAVSGKPGVAQVDLPIDVSADDLGPGEVPEPIPVHTPLHRPYPEPALVKEAGGLLRAAERPVLLVGGGAMYSGAASALIELAERLHMPVVNSPTSRNAVPETHPLVLGPSGIIGYEPVGDAIKEADLVLAIGSRLSDLQTARGALLPGDAPIIQVDIDSAAIGQNHAVTVGIAADARACAEALNEGLVAENIEISSARRDWVTSLATRIADWQQTWFDATPDNGKVQPQEVVQALMTLPPETIFTHGAGDHGFYGYMVPVAAPGAHLVSTRLGAMGCALGLALGAKLSRPDQTVIGCVGDGDFMLQIGDLETMARENLSAVMVVFNNFRLGSQRKRVEAYGNVMGVDHGNPDFAKVAALFGCRGFRVDMPGQFDATLREALVTGAPCVIDVIMDPDARPPRIAASREAR